MKSKRSILIVMALFLVAGAGCTQKRVAQGDGRITQVPFTAVKVTDDFWAPRIKTNHEVTIPIAISQSEETGRIRNFMIAGGLAEGQFCSIYPFDDSDVFKIIEGASYSLQTFPDTELEARIDSLIYYIGLAQEDDGYLYTYRTIMGDDSHPWVGKRWEKTHILSHELYNLGHMYEAAVANHQATGKREFLDIALRSAELVDKDFGWGKFESYPGHQEIEIGLVKLYRETGERKYLDLAKFFLDVRGPGGDEYNQAHLKVVDQAEAVGHSVRAGYMYTGMADVAGLTGDSAYVDAIGRIWDDIVHTKMYITGGIGASGGNEGFGEPYHLPNMSAYCETCASIANVFWNQRMFLQHGESKYLDVMERTLYNALLSGVSLSGDLFFYPNVLESSGQHKRQEWFGCACCPSNISRFIPSVPGYIYATRGNEIFVNMYLSNSGNIEIDSNRIVITQSTSYPWSGNISISIDPEREADLDLKLRIPGWARGEAIPGDLYTFVEEGKRQVRVKINGKSRKVNYSDGYATLSRRWKKGDVVELELPMHARKVVADPRVEADQNRFAVQRGPLVYCAEWPDNSDGKILNLVFDPDAGLTEEFVPGMLNGTEVIRTTAHQVMKTLDGTIETGEKEEITLIPYHLWNNRGPGEMEVWLPVTENSARALPAPTIAYRSKVSVSKETSAKMSVNDQYEPTNSNDHTYPYYHWWPENNSWQWIEYDFPGEETVSACRVYWFDDGPDGGCRVPDEWEVVYMQNGEWIPVSAVGEYRITRDDWDEIKFEPVKTTALRLRVRLNSEFSSGVHEWEVW